MKVALSSTHAYSNNFIATPPRKQIKIYVSRHIFALEWFCVEGSKATEADELWRIVRSLVVCFCVYGNRRSDYTQRTVLHTHSMVLWKRLPGVAEGVSRGCRPPAWTLSWQQRASSGCTGDMLRNCKNTRDVCVCLCAVSSHCSNPHKLGKYHGLSYTHTLTHTPTRALSIWRKNSSYSREIERIMGEWALA